MSITANENLGNSSVTSNTSRPQETGSLYGRLVSTISRNSSYIAQSISSIAQSILSKCIYIGSLGRYTLDNLKNYFFSQNAPLESKSSNEVIEGSQSNKSLEQLNIEARQNEAGSTSMVPPPPPLPSSEQLNTVTRESQISSTSMPIPPPLLSSPPLVDEEERFDNTGSSCIEGNIQMDQECINASESPTSESGAVSKKTDPMNTKSDKTSQKQPKSLLDEIKDNKAFKRIQKILNSKDKKTQPESN